MAQYTVVITQSIAWDFLVTAESEELAKQVAEEMALEALQEVDLHLDSFEYEYEVTEEQEEA